VVVTSHHRHIQSCACVSRYLRLTHLATNLGTEEDVGKRDELNEAAHEAVLADFLGNASLRVARSDVGDEAYAAVVEAAEQTVLKLAHRCRR